jgi:hypothetical protein
MAKGKLLLYVSIYQQSKQVPYRNVIDDLLICSSGTFFFDWLGKQW